MGRAVPGGMRIDIHAVGRIFHLCRPQAHGLSFKGSLSIGDQSGPSHHGKVKTGFKRP